MLEIQYISDIHLEFHINIPIINAVAPILCLLGDIGYPNSTIYKDFLLNLNNNPKFEKIFLITGNHEYYNQNESIESTNNKINSIIQLNNLHKISFLNNTTEFYNNYLFIGSTLWSFITSSNNNMNDFNCIENMTRAKYNNLHIQSVFFINNQLRLNSDKKIIILTHHLPSFKLIDDKYLCYSNMNQYFASHCDHLIIDPVILWLYGHTHTPNITKINNTILLCNPIGYIGENQNINFDKKIII